MRDDGIDNPTPLRVTINAPTMTGVETQRQRGRNSTYSPDALVTSIRLPGVSVDAIDHACALIDPALTRSMFIRLSCERVADAIIAHNLAYLEHIAEQTDE